MKEAIGHGIWHTRLHMKSHVFTRSDFPRKKTACRVFDQDKLFSADDPEPALMTDD
jgi:hypothetical protein